MSIFAQFYKRFQLLGIRLTRSDIARVLVALFLLTLVGTVSYALIEGWSLLDSLYATIITITTVGYGDVTPVTPLGRTFAIVFTLIAITIAGYSISTLAAYTIERRSRKLAEKFRKRQMKQIASYKQHYILCGADLLGTRIAEEFHLQKADYVVIDDDEKLIKTTMLFSHPEYFQKKLRNLTDFDDIDVSDFEDRTLEELSERLNVPYILADPTDDAVLVKAGIDRAAGLIAARPDDRDNLSIVIGARSLANRSNNTSLRIMTRATDPINMRKMYLAGADFVRIPTIMSGMEMAMHMLHPEIGNWWYSHVGGNRERVGMFQQINLSDRPAWHGLTVAELHKNEKVLVVSVKRDGEFLSPPAYDLAFRPDDILITSQ
jgi:voltage-gated potassium channel